MKRAWLDAFFWGGKKRASFGGMWIPWSCRLSPWPRRGLARGPPLFFLNKIYILVGAFGAPRRKKRSHCDARTRFFKCTPPTRLVVPLSLSPTHLLAPLGRSKAWVLFFFFLFVGTLFLRNARARLLVGHVPAPFFLPSLLLHVPSCLVACLVALRFASTLLPAAKGTHPPTTAPFRWRGT